MQPLLTVLGLLRGRLAELRRSGDAGTITETVLVVALLGAAAIAILAIIVAKVNGRAQSINLG